MGVQSLKLETALPQIIAGNVSERADRQVDVFSGSGLSRVELDCETAYDGVVDTVRVQDVEHGDEHALFVVEGQLHGLAPQVVEVDPRRESVF